MSKAIDQYRFYAPEPVEYFMYNPENPSECVIYTVFGKLYATSDIDAEKPEWLEIVGIPKKKNVKEVLSPGEYFYSFGDSPSDPRVRLYDQKKSSASASFPLSDQPLEPRMVERTMIEITPNIAGLLDQLRTVRKEIGSATQELLGNTYDIGAFEADFKAVAAFSKEANRLQEYIATALLEQLDGKKQNALPAPIRLLLTYKIGTAMVSDDLLKAIEFTRLSDTDIVSRFHILTYTYIHPRNHVEYEFRIVCSEYLIDKINPRLFDGSALKDYFDNMVNDNKFEELVK